MPSYPSISLSHLPLRPSTLTLLQQHGYLTLAELMESKALGGLATLAAELHVDSAHVLRLLQEIQDCLTASTSVTRSSDGSASGPLELESRGWLASRSTPWAANHSSENTNPSCSGSRTTNIPQLLVKPPPMLTASDIISKASLEKGGIITFCKSLDVLLHRSGIPLGSLTEIAGLPGLGKTQFGMQLAVNARLPTRLGGVQGQTLYIDAEGSLAPERLQSMAEGLLQHCQNTLRKRGKELPLDFREPSQILQDIHVFRVLDEAAQTATLYSLPYWIEQLSKSQTDESTTRTPVKLIVVDSIAFHYRCASGTSQDYQERSRSLTRLAAFLNDVARDYNVAVVCLNQMTTTKKTDGGGGPQQSSTTTSRLVPALGESWAHAVTTRLLLSECGEIPPTIHSSSNTSGGRRYCCRLVKSPCMPSGTSYYQIKDVGIRDAESPPPRNRTPNEEEDQAALTERPVLAPHESVAKRPRTT